MKAMKNPRSRAIQQAVFDLEPERVYHAICALQASGDLDAWEEVLQDTIIDLQGRLHASSAMMLSAQDQQLADHALLELIGSAPEGAVLNPTIQRKNIKKLTFRNINRNDLPSNAYAPLPIGIYRMHALEDIDVHGVRNLDLPDGISALPALRRLRLANAGIFELPADIAQCHQLEFLDLSLNLLSHFPRNVTEIRSLRELHLDGNYFEELPAELQALDRLEVIRLPENSFTKIPAVLTQMPSLKKIIISYNRLKGKIPRNITSLPALELLDIAGNRQMKLPATMNHLRSGLQIVHVHGRSGEQPVTDGQNYADEAPGEAIRAWVENIDGYLSAADRKVQWAGVELLQTINDPELFRYLVRHWSIRDGALVCDAPKDEEKAGAYIDDREQLVYLLLHSDNEYLTSTFDGSKITTMGLAMWVRNYKGFSQKMPNIEHLSISGLVQDVVPLLSEFKKLRSLDIIGTHDLHSFDLEGMPALEDIDFVGGSCKKFVIHDCPALTTMDVRGRNFAAIRLSNNPRLNDLHLTPEQMPDLVIDNCPALRSLTLLGRSDLKRFQFDDLSQLESLNINQIHHTDLIARLFEAPQLREITLGLDWNHGRPPVEINGLPRPSSPHITAFRVCKIGISSIPDWLMSMDALEVLNLSENRLKRLPRDWTGNRSLKKLVLEGNQIEEIPADIQLPPSLAELHLGQNNLNSLPEILATLPALKHLQLDTQSSLVPENSSLQHIPPALSGKPGLKISIRMDEMEKRKMMVEGLVWQLRQYGHLVDGPNR